MFTISKMQNICMHFNDDDNDFEIIMMIYMMMHAQSPWLSLRRHTQSRGSHAGSPRSTLPNGRSWRPHLLALRYPAQVLTYLDLVLQCYY